VPKCGVCGQAEHKVTDGLVDHCTTCREPVFIGTTYWLQCRPYHLSDKVYCELCITWTKHADQSVLRRAESIYRRSLR
jgi:hypothetical protein